jgi:hypothetical protein
LKVPSDAVIKRSGDYYILTRSKQTGESNWAKIEVLKRDVSDAYVKAQLDDDKEVLRITKELSSIEGLITKDKG